MTLFRNEVPQIIRKYDNFKVNLTKKNLTDVRIVRNVEYPIKFNITIEPYPETIQELEILLRKFFSDLGTNNILTDLITIHGLVIIENLKTTDPNFYSNIIRDLFQVNYKEFEQVGLLAPREIISKSVSSVGVDDELGKNKTKLNSHQEFSRYLEFPHFLTFFCEREPKLGGGESTTTHATELFDRVASKYPNFIKELYEKNGTHLYQKFDYKISEGSKYKISWVDKNAFGKYITSEEIENSDIEKMKEKAIKLANERVSAHIEFDENNDLLLHQTNDIVQIHPFTKLPIIFSSLPTYWAGYYNAKKDPKNLNKLNKPLLTYGNGEKIPEEYLDYLFEQSIELEYVHSFQNGDILLLDNYSVYHGRNKYEAGGRVIRASFWDNKEEGKLKPYKPTKFDDLISV